MMRHLSSSLVLAGALAIAGCIHSSASSPTRPELEAAHDHGGEDHAHTHVPRRGMPEGAGAPLFDDLGSYRRAITTGSDLAARYFSQGLVLAYGFNHAEARRSFREASRQDPSCAICAWGEAYVLGPNINKLMDDADVPAAWEAAQRAVSLAGGASPVERDLIGALAARYAKSPVSDRSSLDLAYADAMREVTLRHPDDDDVQTLFAEALMDTMPWDYWQDPVTPKPATREVLAALETVMARDPEHPGALHFYIHAVEPSKSPERGEPAADRLGSLVPGAGHLVHMPSHIYLRVGRYHEASLANEKAAAADESYITQCRAQGFYPAAYYPHNVHFLYAASAFEGRSEVSLAAARKLSANMTPDLVEQIPVVEEFVPMELFALARFGRWQDLLRAEAPPEAWRYTTGVWRYARGMARAAEHELDAAREELAALRHIATEPALSEMVFTSGSSPATLLTIGIRVLDARIAGESGHWDQAIAPLREAVAIQDGLPYTEPPPWYFPVREALGHALLRAGRPAEAEAVYREQLADTPRNGWSLLGLAESLHAQGLSDEADATRAQLAKAWERADIALTSSVF